MQEAVKVGIIGVGRMGELHLKKYLSIPSVQVAGVFEPNEKRAQHIAENYGVKVFPSVAELVFEADAVSVTSTTPTHFSNCRQALEAGVHVLVEKPMCDEPVHAAELIQIAKAKNVTLQVGYLERFRLSRVTRFVPRSTLKFIEARWSATQLPRESHIDVVADLLVHPLDMVLSLCHEEPQDIRVSGFPFLTNQLDIFETRLEFPSGLVAHLLVNRVAQHRERRISLYSPQATASLNFLTNHVEVVRNASNEIERVSIESEGADPDVLKQQLESFIQAVQTGSAPLVSAEDGLRVLKTLQRLRSAFQLSEPLVLPQDPSLGTYVS